MTPGSNFLQAFEQMVGASGWRTLRSPAQLVEQWDSFVTACEEGYDDTIYEFTNERSVRDLLEAALTNRGLQRYGELDDLRRSVAAIDARFRAACRDDAEIEARDSPWWHRCVPTKAGGQLAEDLKSRYGIEPLSDS